MSALPPLPLCPLLIRLQRAAASAAAASAPAVTTTVRPFAAAVLAARPAPFYVIGRIRGSHDSTFRPMESTSVRDVFLSLSHFR